MSLGRALSLLLGLALAGCHEHEAFVHACSDVQNGMTRSAVDERLGLVGATRSVDGDTETWTRPSLVGSESCAVLYDARGRVRVASYHDWIR